MKTSSIQSYEYFIITIILSNHLIFSFTFILFFVEINKQLFNKNESNQLNNSQSIKSNTSSLPNLVSLILAFFPNNHIIKIQSCHLLSFVIKYVSFSNFDRIKIYAKKKKHSNKN